MELKILRDKTQFQEAKEKWNRIVETMEDSTPFQSWEWNYYWWQNHEQESELFILEAFEIKDVFGYAPLIITDGVIRFLGDKHFDYGMFICAQRRQEIIELFFKTILNYCREKKATFHFDCIPVWCAQYGFFREQAHTISKILLREQVDTAGIKLAEYGDFHNYKKAISSSLRKKAIRPCQKNNFVYEIEEFSETLWNDIEEIYSERQEDRVGRSTLSWAKDMVKELSTAKIMKISTLKYEGKRVAYLIFFEIKGADYIWLTAFKKVEKYQLGHYIRHCLIERAYACGIDKVDMMRGAYAYKKQWDCSTSVNCEMVYFTYRYQKWSYILWKKLRTHLRNYVYGNQKLFNLYKTYTSK